MSVHSADKISNPVEQLSLPVGFAVACLDGAMKMEQSEIQGYWATVREELIRQRLALQKIAGYTPVSHIQPVQIARAALRGESW